MAYKGRGKREEELDIKEVNRCFAYHPCEECSSDLSAGEGKVAVGNKKDSSYHQDGIMDALGSGGDSWDLSK